MANELQIGLVILGIVAGLFFLSVIYPRLRGRVGGFRDAPQFKQNDLVVEPRMDGQVGSLKAVMPFKDKSGIRMRVQNAEGLHIIDWRVGEYVTGPFDGGRTVHYGVSVGGLFDSKYALLLGDLKSANARADDWHQKYLLLNRTVDEQVMERVRQAEMLAKAGKQVRMAK